MHVPMHYISSHYNHFFTPVQLAKAGEERYTWGRNKNQAEKT